MSNLAKFGSGGIPADPKSLLAGLQNMQAAPAPNTTGDTLILKLSKQGEWIYGPEDIEVEEGSTWAINPYSIQYGYVCWGDGQLLGESMVPCTQPLPDHNALPSYGEPWKLQYAVGMACVSGDDEGLQVLYRGTSVGMQKAVRGINAELIARVQQYPTQFVPIVSLDVDSYKHKSYGKIYTPVLTIVGWSSMEGENGAPTPAAEPDPQETVQADLKNGEIVGDIPNHDAPAKPSRRRRRAQ